MMKLTPAALLIPRICISLHIREMKEEFQMNVNYITFLCELNMAWLFW